MLNLFKHHSSIKPFLILLVFGLIFSSCAGVPGGGGLTDPNPATRDSGGENGDGDGGKEPGVPDTPKAEPPVSSIPIPSARGLSAEATIAYACDSGSACPVTGTSDAEMVGFVQDEAVVAYYREVHGTKLALFAGERRSMELHNPSQPPLNLRGGNSPLLVKRGLGGVIEFGIHDPRSTPARQLLGGTHDLFLPSLILSLPAPTNVLGSKPVILSLSKDALAQDFDPNIDFADAPDGDQRVAICDRPNVTCCPVVNGEFECFPMGTNDSTFHYFATDGEQILGEVKLVKPHKQLLFLADVPNDLTLAHLTRSEVVDGEVEQIPDDVWDHRQRQGDIPALRKEVHHSYAIAGQFGKKIDVETDVQFDDGVENKSTPVFKVNGDWRQRYRRFEAGGTKISYKDDVVGILKPDQGIDRKRIVNGEVVDQEDLRQEPGTELYKNIKLTWDDKLRFARVQDVNLIGADSGKIFDVMNANQDASIAFLDRGQGLTHTETIAYDVDSHGCAVVLFKDVGDKLRLRVACNVQPPLQRDGYPPFGGEAPLEGVDAQSDFGDLIIYKENDLGENDVISGKAFLIDKGTKKIWQVEYRVPHILDRGEDPPFITAVLQEDQSIPMGNDLTALTISRDRSWIFAVNAADDKVTAVQLKNEMGQTMEFDQIKNHVASVGIREQLLGRANGQPNNVPPPADNAANNLPAQPGQQDVIVPAIPYVPTSISLYTANANDNYIILGSEGLKGGIVLPAHNLMNAAYKGLAQPRKDLLPAKEPEEEVVASKKPAAEEQAQESRYLEVLTAILKTNPPGAKRCQELLFLYDKMIVGRASDIDLARVKQELIECR